MSVVNGSLQIAKYDSAWFASNSTVVLKQGQLVFNETTSELFIGDGVSQLSNLTAINGGSGSGVQSVTGSQVDNTDPLNPVVIPQRILSSPDGLTTAESADGYFLVQVDDGLGNTVQLDITIDGVMVNDVDNTNSTPTMFDSFGRLKTLTAAVLGGFIVNLTSKITPVNADSIFLSDSAASGTAKKVSLTNFKAFLKTYFDSLYTTSSAVATQITTALSGYLTAATAASTYEPKFTKNTAFNKNFGTGTTDVVEIGATLGNTLPVITNASGKIVTSDWVDYSGTTTVSGFSATSVVNVRYIDMGAYYIYKVYVVGTSNSTSASVTMHVNESYQLNDNIVRVSNNGTFTTGLGRTSIGSNLITFFATAAGGAFTASGSKTLNGTIIIMK